MAAISPEYLKSLLQLLDHCIAGVLDDAKLARVSDTLRELGFCGDRLLDHAVHQLHHFVQDADIRSRDPEYGAVQRKELRNIADEIRKSYTQRID